LLPVRWQFRWQNNGAKKPSAPRHGAKGSGFRRNRCLIPMSGYYEWQDTPSGKQPWYYTARDGSALTAAGLWDSWRNPEADKPHLSCTKIVVEPNTIVAEIHDRNRSKRDGRI